MKQSVKIFCTVLLSIQLLSCHNTDTTSNDPNEVLNDFFQHLAKKDIDGAAKYVTADSKFVLNMMQKGIEMSQKLSDSLADANFSKQLEDIEIQPAKISNDSAFVNVSNKHDEKWNTTFILLKQSNGWKVDFTMKSLMQMGTKMSANEGANEKKVVVDSQDLQKGLKMADSVLKNLDPKMIEQIQKQLEGLK